MKNVLFISLLAGLALSCALQETPVSVPLTLSIGPDDARAVSFPGTRFTNYALVQSLTLSIMKPNGDPVSQVTKNNPLFPSSFDLDLPTGKPYLVRIEARNGQMNLLATNFRQIFLDGTEQKLRLPLMAGIEDIENSISSFGGTAQVRGLSVVATFSQFIPTAMDFTVTNAVVEGVSYKIDTNAWVSSPVTSNEINVAGIPDTGTHTLSIRLPDGLGGYYVYSILLVGGI